MGDRTYTSIRFSGKITRAVAKELIAELEGQSCRRNDHDGTAELDVEMLTDCSFYDSECNYAIMEGVEAVCAEHNISYRKQWEPGGDYGPGIELFDGTHARQIGTLEGEPVVTLSQIKELGIGVMGYLQSFADDLPPLQIIDDDDDDDAPSVLKETTDGA